MKKVVLSVMIPVILLFSGCSALNTIAAVYSLVNCIYKIKSISHLTLSGMDFSNGLTASMLPQALSMLSGQQTSLPLSFTVNIDVQNPNSGPAAFEAMDYILSIDDVQFTTGSFAQAFSVGAGETKNLPMNISFDIAQLLRGDSKSAVQNIVKNLIGINDAQSEVKLQLKPSFKVGQQNYTSPSYIPVNFTLGGRK